MALNASHLSSFIHFGISLTIWAASISGEASTAAARHNAAADCAERSCSVERESARGRRMEEKEAALVMLATKAPVAAAAADRTAESGSRRRRTTADTSLGR